MSASVEDYCILGSAETDMEEDGAGFTPEVDLGVVKVIYGVAPFLLLSSWDLNTAVLPLWNFL